MSDTPDKSGSFSDAFAKQQPPGAKQRKEGASEPAPNSGEVAKPDAPSLKSQILRALFLALMGASLAISPAHAQKTKAQLNSEVLTNLPDNTTGQITPAGMRALAADTVNSIMPTAPVISGNLACFNGTTGLLQDCGTVPIISAATPLILSGGTISCPGCVPSGSRPYVLPIDFGITCDGATDWHTQLQSMISASAGKVIYLPPGPSCVNNASTLTLPSNTTIIGGGREVSILKCTNLGPVPCFTSVDTTNITFRDFWIQGNDSVASWTASSFGAFQFLQDASATGNQTYTITGMKFSGFNTNYWGYIQSSATTFFQLLDITLSNNLIVTANADIPTDALASNNTNYGFAIFSGTGGHGEIVNLQAKNNRMESSYMCFPLAVLGNSYKTQITDNLITDPGQTTPTHCSNGGLTTQNSYGILVYDTNGDGFPPTNFLVSSNTIINPYATGIYAVGDGAGGHTGSIYNSSGSVISNNLIDGQTSQSDATLPRGGIVVALLTDVDIIGNKIRNSFGGIAAMGQQTGVVRIASNSCTTGVSPGASTPYCIKIGSGANGSSNTSKHIVSNNYDEMVITASGNCLVGISATGARFGDVEISNNTFNCGWNGVNFQNQFVAGTYVQKNNKFGGVANNFMASVAGLTGATATIMGDVYDSLGGVNGNGLLVSSDTVALSNIKFINRTSGTVAMFSAAGACGSIHGFQFENVVQAAQVAATSLGLINPSGCTLNYGQVVQNLSPSEQGAAASKYAVDHWSHLSTTASTTHLDQRMLTGN
jgi:hypothetical protein